MNIDYYLAAGGAVALSCFAFWRLIADRNYWRRRALQAEEAEIWKAVRHD